MSIETPVPRVSSKNHKSRHRWSPWPARVWPVLRYTAASRRTLIGAGTAGVVGAVFLAGPGIGYPVTAASVLAAVGCAHSRRPTNWQFAGAAAILALASVALLRSSEWLVMMSAWTAVLVAGAVSAGSWTWRGTIVGALTPVLVPIRVIRWGSRGVRRLDAGRIQPARIVVVTVVTAALVVVFAALFAAADPTFDRIVDDVMPEWDPSAALGRLMVFLLVAGGALAASYLAFNRPHLDRLGSPSTSAIPMWEWGIPVAALVAVFTTFVGVQLTTLFGGQNHVAVTDGLTNAEYARRGFWQLLAVTALTLLVIAVVIRKASTASSRDRFGLRTLLGLLCLLSIVVVASALHRMSLYEQQYGYTTLRLFVTAVELFLGSVFLMVMATGVRMSGRWLPRAVGAVAVSTVLGLAVLNPDAYIARHNVDRFEATGKVDIGYLSRLSADAAHELNRLPEPYRSCVLSSGTGSGSWREWNLSDSRAATMLEESPVTTCRSHLFG